MDYILKLIEQYLAAFANWIWGAPLLVIILGGGAFFMIYSRFLPFRHLPHAVKILTGKYDDPDDPGDINHFQALSSALAATVGMGNISGVAIAIFMGGPGALFWMWVSAFFGIATKFFTCTLAILYRGKDTLNHIQGGPMYVIREGLNKSWKPMAVLFAVAGLFGPLPSFQSNQLTQILREVIFIPYGLASTQAHFTADFITGLVLVGLVSLVIFGGIKRIGRVAGRLVPIMVALYVGLVLIILSLHIHEIPHYLSLIITDAFTGEAAAGGVLGSVIVTGIRRGAFSNEAGIGTEALAHGAAKTNEPVREGLVAMLGPAIDTIIVCSMTGLAILVTGVWKTGDANGVALTLDAFNAVFHGAGSFLLVLCVLIFSISSMLTYSYYGSKCLGFLVGAQYQHWYNIFYIIMIIFGSVASLKAVFSLIDAMFAIMAIPTMTSSIVLAPRVMEAARDYFSRLDTFKTFD